MMFLVMKPFENIGLNIVFRQRKNSLLHMGNYEWLRLLFVTLKDIVRALPERASDFRAPLAIASFVSSFYVGKEVSGTTALMSAICIVNTRFVLKIMNSRKKKNETNYLKILKPAKFKENF